MFSCFCRAPNPACPHRWILLPPLGSLTFAWHNVQHSGSIYKDVSAGWLFNHTETTNLPVSTDPFSSAKRLAHEGNGLVPDIGWACRRVNRRLQRLSSQPIIKKGFHQWVWKRSVQLCFIHLHLPKQEALCAQNLLRQRTDLLATHWQACRPMWPKSATSRLKCFLPRWVTRLLTYSRPKLQLEDQLFSQPFNPTAHIQIEYGNKYAEALFQRECCNVLGWQLASGFSQKALGCKSERFLKQAPRGELSCLQQKKIAFFDSRLLGQHAGEDRVLRTLDLFQNFTSWSPLHDSGAEETTMEPIPW